MDIEAKIIRSSFIQPYSYNKNLPLVYLKIQTHTNHLCDYGHYSIPVYVLRDEDGNQIDLTQVENLNKYNIDVKELLGKKISNISLSAFNKSNLLTQLRQINNGAYSDREFCIDNEWHGELIPTGYTAGFWLEKDKTLSPVIRKLAFEVT